MDKITTSAIILDFDGTMVDSFVVTLDILYGLTHTQPLRNEDISRLRGTGMVRLLRELQVPWWQVFFLARRVRHLMSNQMTEIQLVPGIAEAVKALSKKHKLFVLTSNSANNVSSLLERSGIDSYFTNIYGNANPLHKAHELSRMLKQNNLSKKLTWYVGDEPQDIHAAKDVGIGSIAVSWGYSNIHILKSHRPDRLVFSPDELLALFAKQIS
ncbi:MAG: HAD-IA family hydrolase [Candidatus Saccharimonadales bacterium]